MHFNCKSAIANILLDIFKGFIQTFNEPKKYWVAHIKMHECHGLMGLVSK